MITQNASQKFVPVADIHDNTVVLKDGQLCMVLLSSSINFALKSVEEQQAILSQFQSFFNSIDFSVQFYVQSRRLDIRPYIDLIKEREPLQDNDLMRIQLREYMSYINKFTQEHEIMAKNFYVIVSYAPVGIEVKGFMKFFKKKQTPESRADKFFEDRTQLEQRVSVVEEGLRRVGIRSETLGTDELTELYYHIFNPADLSNAPQR